MKNKDQTLSEDRRFVVAATGVGIRLSALAKYVIKSTPTVGHASLKVWYEIADGKVRVRAEWRGNNGFGSEKICRWHCYDYEK